MKKRIIIISNRLPVSITEESGSLTLQRGSGGLATALTSLMDDPNYDVQWIGWSGLTHSVSRRKLAKAGWDNRLVPMAIAPDLLDKYYKRMANGVLWPTLHGMPANIRHTSEDWQAYLEANYMFAAKLKKILKPTDSIWVHDYHLLALPQILREAGIVNRIGFFLHTPLASTSCLAQLPEEEAIIRSLAQADVLGFQTQRDVDNFQGCLQELGIAMRPGSVLQAFPIGVDFAGYQTARSKYAVQGYLQSAQVQLGNRRAILSVSRLDYTKGIPEQLQAVESLLESVADPATILYKLIVEPSREDVAGYGELKARIQQEVARINNRFASKGYQPVDFTYRKVGYDELHAWYQLADIMLVTPIIDGMNLVVKEYIAAKHNKPGMVVLSNTIGAAQQLHAALLTDPNDTTAITEQLQTALRMSASEQNQRWAMLRRSVDTEDVFWWLNEFVSALDSTAQSVLLSQAVHRPRMRFSRRLPAMRFLRLASQR